MKKLIQILFSLPIIAAPVFSAVSCSKKTALNPYESHDKGSASLKMMSQILLSGRHENMNFNTNELISNLITPNQAFGGIPTRFNYKGKVIDFSGTLNDYIGRMAPALGALEKNSADIVGSYNSYIMGMYDDNFYKNYQTQGYFADTLGVDGKIGLFGKGNGKSMSILPGMNKDIHLSKETSRKELAWGIQDQGPLTNFLLEHGYDGAPAAMVPNTKGPSNSAWDDPIPNLGTNCGGYMYYNSDLSGVNVIRNWMIFPNSTKDNHFRDSKYVGQLNAMKINETSNNQLTLKEQDYDKFKNSILTYNKDGKNPVDLNFNETGSYLAKTSGELLLVSKVANASALLSNISDTESGTNILVRFLDELLPIRDYDAGGTADLPTLTNIITAGTYMGFIADLYKTSDGSLKDNVIKALGDDIAKNPNLIKPIGSFTDADTGVVGLGAKGPSLKFMFKDEQNAANVLKQAKLLLEAIISKYNKMSESKRIEYNNQLADAIGGSEGQQHAFVRDYTSLVGGKNVDIIKDVGKQLNKKNNKHDLINLLSFADSMYGILSDDVNNGSVFDSMVQFANSNKSAVTSAGQVLVTSLNDAGFNNVKRILGVKNGKAAKNSALDKMLKVFTLNKSNDSTVGAQVVKDTVASVGSGVDNGIAEPYEKVLSHVVGDDEWKMSDVKQNFTSINDTSGVMSFTLDYNGIGDSSSNADKQTKKVDDSLLDNFNPYQTITDHFTKDNDYNKNLIYKGSDNVWDHNRTSGVVLGKDLLTKDKNKLDDALINYDGKGILKDYKPVHHRYKVEWKNVGLENSPYWIMTKVDCFNVEGDKETQFYNIY